MSLDTMSKLFNPSKQDSSRIQKRKKKGGKKKANQKTQPPPKLEPHQWTEDDVHVPTVELLSSIKALPSKLVGMGVVLGLPTSAF